MSEAEGAERGVKRVLEEYAGMVKELEEKNAVLVREVALLKFQVIILVLLPLRYHSKVMSPIGNLLHAIQIALVKVVPPKRSSMIFESPHVF